MDNYDVIVVGAGPGGYVAAIRCAQLGFKTACIDAWTNPEGAYTLGGTCLNVGCIPSKALLDSSHHYEHITRHAAAHGIAVRGEVEIDIAAMQNRKQKIVATLTQGIVGLFKKNKITWVQGRGFLQPDHQVSVRDGNGEETARLQAQHIIIATGSVPANIPVAAIDHNQIVDSTGALAFDHVPKRLGIIGAGVIGLELGSVWRRLGAEVTIFEALPEFLAGADPDVSKEALKILTKQGLDIRLNTKVTGVNPESEGVAVKYTGQDGDDSAAFDRVIVAVGRVPNTAGLGADDLGITMARGFIQVNHQLQTNIPGIYAIGDCVGGPMLAHKASEEGVAVAEIIAGQKPHLDHTYCPWVIYTWPEIAWAGSTEADLKSAQRAYKVGKFPFMASGRARAMGETAGFVKLLSDATSDALLGAHIIGPNASELIAEAVVAMSFLGSAEDLARTIHAHPTLAESMHEAALASDKRAIHV